MFLVLYDASFTLFGSVTRERNERREEWNGKGGANEGVRVREGFEWREDTRKVGGREGYEESGRREVERGMRREGKEGNS